MCTLAIQNEFEDALIAYNKTQALSIFNDFLSSHKANAFIDQVMVAVMDRIGTQWEKGELSLSQVYLSSKLCEEIVGSMVTPVATATEQPKIAVVTLADHHVLGKRILTAMLRANGYAFTDYGLGVSAEKVISNVLADGTTILLISVLMLNSALQVKQITDAFKARKLSVKVMVGGAPFRFDHSLCKQVGADASANTAAAGIQIMKKWHASEGGNV